MMMRRFLVHEREWAPSNVTGALFTLLALASTTVAFGLGSFPSWIAWTAGQVILGIALLQWFILLHECGHFTLFRSRAPNIVAGHIASFFAVIPFVAWRWIHRLHHQWTGWQDLDPTTASLAPRRRSQLETRAADLAWKYWIPVFSIIYRVSNYWNLGRVRRFVGERKKFGRLYVNCALLLAAYGAVVYVVGAGTVLRVAGAGFLLHLVLQDPLILSQHTHMPADLSSGSHVKPFPAGEQERFTRSLRFPEKISHWILIGFDAHELHHSYPSVPGYRLRRLRKQTPNEVNWREWIANAKKVPGSVFLFENRDRTGIRV